MGDNNMAVNSDSKENVMPAEKAGKMQHFQDGDIIFKENDIHPYMYKVLKGNVALYVNYEQEHENVLGIVGDDQFFGEISMLTGRPQVYTAVALKDTLLMKVDEDQLEQFLRDNHGSTLDIMRSMARVIATQSFDIATLMDDLQTLYKELPDDNHLDPDMVIRMKQYQLQYVEKTYTPEASFFSAQG